jgi:hypothetical protein
MDNETNFLTKIKQESQAYLDNYEADWNETETEINEFNKPLNPALVENLESNKKVLRAAL